MKRPESPCKTNGSLCLDHSLECKRTCEKYKTFLQQQSEFNRIVRLNRNNNPILAAYANERAIKRAKEKHKNPY